MRIHHNTIYFCPIVQHRAACNVHQCTTTGSQIFVVSHSNKSPILALAVGWSHFFRVISPGKYSRNHRNMGCNNFRLKPCNVCNSTSPCQQRHTVGNTKVPLPMMWFIHIWAHFRDDCSQAISFHQRRESFFVFFYHKFYLWYATLTSKSSYEWRSCHVRSDTNKKKCNYLDYVTHNEPVSRYGNSDFQINCSKQQQVIREIGKSIILVP